MAVSVGTNFSPRHGFKFVKVPAGGGKWAEPTAIYPAEEYGARLDSVYEMACDVADANGITEDSAVRQVVADEGWKILPTHIDMLVKKVEARK